MRREELFDQIKKKQSYLCVGLDTDIKKIPPHLLGYEDPIYEFNRQIIDATVDCCVAYKPNIAFYEAMGARGWESLRKTLAYIPEDIFTIADAKRGDIGNTSALYARTFFDKSSAGLDFDAVTVAPYMGSDSVGPFLEFKDRWVILLALTSNESSSDFQRLTVEGQACELYEAVLEKSKGWGDSDQMMYVVGATRSDMLEKIRKIVPDHFLLVPGIGAQGGDLEEVSRYGMNSQCGLLVNSSRGIIYSSGGKDFAKDAKAAASKIQEQMALCLQKYL